MGNYSSLLKNGWWSLGSSCESDNLGFPTCINYKTSHVKNVFWCQPFGPCSLPFAFNDNCFPPCTFHTNRLRYTCLLLIYYLFNQDTLYVSYVSYFLEVGKFWEAMLHMKENEFETCVERRVVCIVYLYNYDYILESETVAES